LYQRDFQVKPVRLDSCFHRNDWAAAVGRPYEKEILKRSMKQVQDKVQDDISKP
jgi:hypothetical protein